MAIREYGESLLQDVRDRKDAEAKRIRKRERKGELLGLAGIGLVLLNLESSGTRLLKMKMY